MAYTITKWSLAYVNGSQPLASYYTTKQERMEIRKARAPAGLEESVFAASAHLKLLPLFHKLSKSQLRNRRTYFGWILESAVAIGDIETTRIALQRQFSTESAAGMSIELAACRGYTRIVGLLVNAKHNFLLKGNVYRAAIREAARHDHMDTLFVLLMTALTGRLVSLD